MVMRNLASNSIPLLLDWIKREDRPTPRARIAAVKDGAIAFLERHKVIRPGPHSIFMDWKESYRSLAQGALAELGSDAKAAIPALIQMLGTKGPTTNDFSPVAGNAYLLLPKMAPAAIRRCFGVGLNPLRSRNSSVLWNPVSTAVPTGVCRKLRWSYWVGLPDFSHASASNKRPSRSRRQNPSADSELDGSLVMARGKTLSGMKSKSDEQVPTALQQMVAATVKNWLDENEADVLQTRSAAVPTPQSSVLP
jgi:hypothetical protein